MRTLRVLGGLWLDDGVRPSSGRGAQRRRLALLTLLALSPGRRLTRDKALAALWPENTNAEGRRRLSSAVYDLRSMLGEDAIESGGGGDELWIAPSAALRIDVEEFEAALARGDPDSALAWYGGPLLDGVHLSGADEFEEWIASHRERLRRLYLQALEQAVAARLSRGDHAGAVSAALQVADLEPLSGHAALVAVNALVEIGDRPRALHVADAHAARVRRELGVDPDDAVVAVTRRLRTRSDQRSSRADASQTGPISATVGAAAEVSESPLPTLAPIDGRTTRRFSPMILRGTVAASLVVAAIAGVAYRSRASAPGSESAGSVRLSGITTAAERSTRSPAALKSFLDGEAAYGTGHYRAAAKFFRAALAEDSTFALAHYRLSQSMLWEEEPGDFATVHDSLALVWSSGLPERERMLIRGYVAWRRGDYETADSLDLAVIHRDRTSADAQFQFGEVLFHYNPLRGRSAGEAADEFNLLVLQDSTNWGAAWHLLLLDASRIVPVEFHRRADRLLAAQPDGQAAAELRLFAADSGHLTHLAATATSTALYDAAWRRAVFRRDLSGAETLLARMTDQNRDEGDRTAAAFAIAALRLGVGRAADAVRVLQNSGSTRVSGGEAWVTLLHGLLANRADGSLNLDSLDRAFWRWRQTLPGFDQPSRERLEVVPYFEGLIAAARGDTIAALRSAEELDGLARRDDATLATYRNPRELALTVRAYEQLRVGRCDAALRSLDEERGKYWLGFIAASPLLSQGLERYIRGECLLALGRYADAIRWFESLEQGTMSDLAFLDAALRGQAAAHRALGEMDAAAAIERRRAELR